MNKKTFQVVFDATLYATQVIEVETYTEAEAEEIARNMISGVDWKVDTIDDVRCTEINEL